MPSYCLTSTVLANQYDSLIAHLSIIGPLGIEEQSGAVGDSIVHAYFKTASIARAAEKIIRQTIPEALTTITEIADQDWNAEWRKSMKPARIASGWYVSPAWLPPRASAKRWIKIEPKMAFGTGHHETTRLAAQAIISLRKHLKNRTLLDIGTGSGVLCFVADCCGTVSCVGVEIDPNCRENIAENAGQNPATGRIDFIIGTSAELRGKSRFDCVVMNMILTESGPLLDKAYSMLNSSGRLVWSGILCDEHEKVVKLALTHGYVLQSEKTENEWWCGVFMKK
ncbi:MAG: 50S ribosomal protein L11 methyltransferase [Chitinispirillaceae bacterium]|jgi:ribosomal protein L11 methyltransferase|nr:50S ribosomal protein L11 methyltransferase [Chitinispirillaceae bacterium]